MQIKHITDSDFWQFSVAFYEYKNNKDLLIALQDKSDANVNLILFIFFLSYNGFHCSITNIQCLIKSILDLDEETKQIRIARRKMKSAIDEQSNSDYKAMLEKELNYERKQQEQLVKCFHHSTDTFTRIENQSGLSKSLILTLTSRHQNEEIIQQLIASFHSFLNTKTMPKVPST